MAIDKKTLSEADIRTKYITPAIEQSGWDKMSQMREEYSITAGRIIARGQVCKREKPLKADYVLFYKPNKPIAIVEAKDNNHSMSDGMQQALNYAQMMNVPFVFSSNGDGFVFHNRYVQEGERETVLPLDGFPSPETLWEMYVEQNCIGPAQSKIIDEPYYVDNPNKQPRYYQINAINRTVEAIAAGQDRVLLVMATGTGKTYTAFQIIWRLWNAGIKKRILFLADRTALISQTSVYKGYKQDKIEMRGDRAEMSDFPLYLNTVAGGLDRRDQTIGGFSFVVKIYAVPVVEIIG